MPAKISSNIIPKAFLKFLSTNPMGKGLKISKSLNNKK